MIKVLILVDKFKGSLTALEVSEAVEKGLLASGLPLHINRLPLADGGDGTLEAVESVGFKRVITDSLDPLGRPVKVPLLEIGDKVLCEMAKSTGLQLLSREERNPMFTSSYGLGLVIKRAAAMGYNRLLVGIGGSATNDGGTGMLEALGFRFKDINGLDVKHGEFITGRDLINIHSVERDEQASFLDILNIEVACDVDNPLTGPRGASHIYAPQKGASPQEIEFMEEGMKNYARVTASFLGTDHSQVPGVGAAGGVGFALKAYCGATLKSGWRILFDFMDVERSIENADVIITGEGRADSQSLSGKLLAGVGELCKKHNKKLWLICGDVRLSTAELRGLGVSEVFSISHIEPDKDRAIKGAQDYLERISQIAATFLKDF